MEPAVRSNDTRATTTTTSTWRARSGSEDCVTSDDNTTPFCDDDDAQVEEFLHDVFLIEPDDSAAAVDFVDDDGVGLAAVASTPTQEHGAWKLKLKLKEITPTALKQKKRTTSRGRSSGQEECPGDDGDPYKQLSPRSRRKRKNRDQMRQARQKEKDTMLKLRETVERLEAKYQRELSQREERKTTSAPSDPKATTFPYMTSYTQNISSFGTGPHSKYSELISASSRLKEENFRLKQLIHEKHKLQETLERNFGDFIQSSPSSPTSLRDTIERMSVADLMDDDFYAPMTTEECWTRIRDTHIHVNAIHQSITKHTAQIGRGQPNYFGWKIQHHFHDQVLLFLFEKPFYHVSAFQAMEQMWANELAMQSYRPDAEAARQTMRVLQHVNEDTYIFQRRMLDPATNTYVKSTYMRFRARTANGYMTGFRTVNPGDFSNGKPKAWASTACIRTEFIQQCSPFGQEYCVVRMIGDTNLQSDTEHDQRVAANTIIGLLQWENKNIGPVFTLTGN